MDLACERLLAVGRRDGLIASTDADSVVADDWLACQLELATRGASAIGGLIELDAAEIARTRRTGAGRARAAQRRAHARGAVEEHAGERTLEHHQFSGASLALTAETYRRCGGLPVRAALEDEALERELQARGVPIHRSRDVRVRTSARTDGRAPRGLARDLARSDWRARRSYRAGEFPLRAPARSARAASSRSCCRRARWRRRSARSPRTPRGCAMLGLLDEVLVVDADSRDGTASDRRATRG